jgi:O-antigen/teichoic acid export membrane protein
VGQQWRSSLAVWVLILVFHDLRLANEIDHGMRGQRNGAQPGVFTLVGTALPLGLTTALIIFNTNIPRYFLQYQFDSQALGIFSVMAYFVVAGAWLVQALGQTIIARLAVSFAANDRAVFLRLSGLYSGLALTFGLAGMLLALFWGDPVIELLYGPEFAGHSQTFIVIMAAGLFFYVEAILTVAITAMRRFRMVMIPQIASLVLSLIGSVFLIPEYGILGAGLVLLLIAIARFGVSAAILVWGISQFGARGRQLSGRP